jgi:predicted metal-dependent peptidase
MSGYDRDFVTDRENVRETNLDVDRENSRTAQSEATGRIPKGAQLHKHALA